MLVLYKLHKSVGSSIEVPMLLAAQKCWQNTHTHTHTENLITVTLRSAYTGEG